MFTPLGKYLRKQRIDIGMTLMQMAKGIDVSSAFLSAVETGKKSPPKGFTDKIATFLNLGEKQIVDLSKLVDASAKEVRISLDRSNDDTRIMASAFARRLERLNDDDMEAIMKILQKEPTDHEK